MPKCILSTPNLISFLFIQRPRRQHLKKKRIITLKLFALSFVFSERVYLRVMSLFTFLPTCHLFLPVFLFFLCRKGSHGVHYFDHFVNSIFAVPRCGSLWVSATPVHRNEGLLVSLANVMETIRKCIEHWEPYPYKVVRNISFVPVHI